MSRSGASVPADGAVVQEVSSIASSPNNSGLRYRLGPSDVVLSRYHVRSLLGKGSYGTVVKAEDLITGAKVAIKLLHKVPGLHRDVHLEERVYDMLVAGCSPSFRLFAEVMNSGTYRGFHCIVFEYCSISLYDVLKGHGDLVPLPRRQRAEIGNQILQGVEYLHSLGIVHTDVKPDNIVLKHSEVGTVRYMDPSRSFVDKKVLISTELRIIDLGEATTVAPGPATVRRIGAHGYRAPEVSLGLPWSFDVDVFGVGCVLAEVHILTNLFNSECSSDREYLAMVDRVAGPFPRDYAADIEKRHPGTFAFRERVTVLYPPLGTTFLRERHINPIIRIERSQPLSAVIHDHDFCDLVKKLLCPDPVRRLSCQEALKHRYFDLLREF